MNLEQCVERIKYLEDRLSQVDVLKGTSPNEISKTALDTSTSSKDLTLAVKNILDLEPPEDSVNTDLAALLLLYKMIYKLENVIKTYDKNFSSNDFVLNLRNIYVEIYQAFGYMIEESEIILSESDKYSDKNTELFGVFLTNLSMFLRAYKKFNEAYENLSDVVSKDFDISNFTNAFNQIKFQNLQIREYYCQTVFSILKFDGDVKKRDIYKFVTSSFCPKTFDDIVRWEKEIEDSKYKVQKLWEKFSGYAKVISNAPKYIQSLFPNLVKILTKLIVVPFNFIMNNWIFFVITKNSISLSFEIFKNYDMSFCNILVILGLAMCYSLKDTYIIGKIAGWFVEKTVNTSTFSVLPQTIGNALNMFTVSFISRLSPYILGKTLTALFYKIINGVCYAFQILYFDGLYSISSMISNFIESLPDKYRDFTTKFVEIIAKVGKGEFSLNDAIESLNVIWEKVDVKSLGSSALNIILFPVNYIWSKLKEFGSLIISSITTKTIKDYTPKKLQYLLGLSSKEVLLLESSPNSLENIKYVLDLFYKRISSYSSEIIKYTTSKAAEVPNVCNVIVQHSKDFLSVIYTNIEEILGECTSAFSFALEIANFTLQLLLFFKDVIEIFGGIVSVPIGASVNLLKQTVNVAIEGYRKIVPSKPTKESYFTIQLNSVKDHIENLKIENEKLNLILKTSKINRDKDLRELTSIFEKAKASDEKIINPKKRSRYT